MMKAEAIRRIGFMMVLVLLACPGAYAAYSEYDDVKKLQKDIEVNREQTKKTLDAKNMEMQGYLAELRTMDQQLKFVKDQTQKDQMKSQRDAIQLKMDDLKKDTKKIQADAAFDQRKLNERIERLKLENIRKKKDKEESRKTASRLDSRSKKEDLETGSEKESRRRLPGDQDERDGQEKKGDWRSTGDWTKPSKDWTKTSSSWK